jgi:hypothetical protein
MGAYDAMFGGETVTSSKDENLIAPKKSTMFGQNPQFQNKEQEEDDLDSMMRGSVERNKLKTNIQQEPNALQRFGQGAASLADTTIGGILPLAGSFAQAAVRPITTPQKAEEFGQQISSVFSQPFGKAFGVTETPGYKNEASQQLMNFIGENVNKGAEWIAKTTGLPIEDVRNMTNSLALGGGALMAKPLGAVGKAVGEKAFALEEKLPKFRVETGKEKLQTQMNQQFQPAGAAATGIQAELQSEIARAKPEIQQQFVNARPEDFTPENLRVVKNHNQFQKFDMTPTEGQALENAQLMSDEYNARVSDPNIRNAYEQRDQKLIQGFDKIRQEAAPDVFDTDPIKLANAPLEKLVSIDTQSLKDINQAYKTFFEAGGKESPVDAQALAKTAIDNLHKNYLYEDAPAAIRNALERHLDGEAMNFEQFSALVKRASTMQRAGGTEAQVGTQLRNALETLPLKGDAIALKELRDNASNLAKQRYDLIEKVPAYKAAALGDTRTKAQIAQGVPHPASNTFLDKYYGAKTPEVDIRNMLDIIGEGSPEHQSLNAALIDKFKKGSGIVEDKGVVKQAALNKQIYDLYKSNKSVMFGNKAVLDLEDLADVARKTEPTTGRHSVNTSNTAVVQEQGAMQSAKEAAKGFAASSLELGVNAAAKGIPVGTVIREAFKGKKAKEAAQAEIKAAEELSKRRLSPTAGLKISDINQNPYRIELTGMAKKEK